MSWFSFPHPQFYFLFHFFQVGLMDKTSQFSHDLFIVAGYLSFQLTGKLISVQGSMNGGGDVGVGWLSDCWLLIGDCAPWS